MLRVAPIRSGRQHLALANSLLLVLLAGSALAQQYPAPIERRPPSVPAGTSSMQPPSAQSSISPLAQVQRRLNPNSPILGEHLAEWINQHRNLTPDQQQQALQREPGFLAQPVPRQQALMNRLRQLETMSPDERQRIVAGGELLERANPAQLQQYRGAMQQLGSLPQEQRAQVARTFRLLREMPPGERINAFNSGRIGTPLSPFQRDTLMRLLQVEPLIPPSPHLRQGQPQ